jgi:hypothetical protein
MRVMTVPAMASHLRSAAEVLVTVTASAILTDREFRNLPDLFLPFRPRQRGTNQAPVEGTIVAIRTRLIGRRLLWRFRRRRYLGAAFNVNGLDGNRRRDRFSVDGFVHGIDGLGHPGQHLFVENGSGILFPSSRFLATLVGMFRITRRATCLFDVFFDHRDDSVVGHAALARTVIVQNVSETQPALLHLFLPTGS